MKKVVISFLIIGVITSLGIIGSKYFNKDKKLDSDKTSISYYVETGEGTGVYEKQDGTTWPEGYVLNEEKSSCDNGSTLSWDSETNSVVVTANMEDSCKVYMDKNVIPIITGVSFLSEQFGVFGVDTIKLKGENVISKVFFKINGIDFTEIELGVRNMCRLDIGTQTFDYQVYVIDVNGNTSDIFSSSHTMRFSLEIAADCLSV